MTITTELEYQEAMGNFQRDLAMAVEKYLELDNEIDKLVARFKMNVAPVAPNVIEDWGVLENFYQARLKYKAEKKAIASVNKSLHEEIKIVEGEIVRLLVELNLLNIWLKVQVDGLCYESYGVRCCHYGVEVQPWITPMPEPYRDPVD